MREPLRIAAEALVAAMQDTSPGATWFLDRHSGEVTRQPGGKETDEPGGEHAPGRWVPIEPIRRSRAWRIMADFVDSLPDRDASCRLGRVLRGRKASAAFVTALDDFPEVRESWRRFQRLAYLQMAEDWLELEEIEAVLVEGG